MTSECPSVNGKTRFFLVDSGGLCLLRYSSSNEFVDLFLLMSMVRLGFLAFFLSLSLSSPPGSPTTIGFFPSPSSLSSPGGLVRMPGLTYNGNGVKDLINAVQGYPVRDGRVRTELVEQPFVNAADFTYNNRCASTVAYRAFFFFFCKVEGLYSSSPERIVRYPLCFPRGYQTRLSCRVSRTRGCLLQLAAGGGRLIF